jgi:hypothetical protein
MVACASVVPEAVVRRTTPYQTFAEEPVEVSAIGEASVPTAVRCPRRAARRGSSSPEIAMSFVAKFR